MRSGSGVKSDEIGHRKKSTDGRSAEKQKKAAKNKPSKRGRKKKAVAEAKTCRREYRFGPGFFIVSGQGLDSERVRVVVDRLSS